VIEFDRFEWKSEPPAFYLIVTEYTGTTKSHSSDPSERKSSTNRFLYAYIKMPLFCSQDAYAPENEKL
jgi:hypothetical protein